VKNKTKGTNAERELIHLLWESGWAACRVAGSGSMSYPAPDILASRNGVVFAIECKTTKKKQQYLEKEEVKQLLEFAQRSGAQPLIAVRFSHEPWYFLTPSQLKETQALCGVTAKTAKKLGLLLNDIF